MNLNQYQRENAVFKIDGYFACHPAESRVSAFDHAKAECLHHLRAQIAHVESITVEQFDAEKRPAGVTTAPLYPDSPEAHEDAMFAEEAADAMRDLPLV